ncbi:MAG TPA: tRNA uridine-5-carboxymethylaminomethyl(34) synthesis GTPase MnmE [Gammaproteobacteria bacterium]|nr:tRNA uridine-5-carboxymethylaminomethyl(34) synthesis GTPase MnmE [Gammaproteobacteria bacterium]
MHTQTTIAAIATPPGRGGIGIIRISGPKASEVALALLKKIPTARQAHYTQFTAPDGTVLDDGLALYFPAPHSFTGEDVLELHGHGGPIILDSLLKHLLNLGIDMARPGEFTERAFLNNKLDLTQAEAIADLIDAASTQAVRSALRSLQGDFSQHIQQLLTTLIELRMYVEAAIDFPEEEINFLADSHIKDTLKQLLQELTQISHSAKTGILLREGMTIVIAGQPNVGKSSLLNCLSGQERAIVTAIPGTTRDVLREHISIDGLPLHIIDTAGLHNSTDPVELEGMRRARNEIENADHLLVMLDATTNQSPTDLLTDLFPSTQLPKNLTFIHNKIDLLGNPPTKQQTPTGHWHIKLSAKTGAGIELLREHLKSCIGFDSTCENTFSARRRHLEALDKAQQHILIGQQQLHQYHAGELLAEELRLAQEALAEITGEFLPDDLLGKIFSNFCIGK